MNEGFRKDDRPQEAAGRRFFTGFQLKWIAMVTMLIDHVGYLFQKQLGVWYSLFRRVGRLAFPIFCFMLVEGFVHTRSRKAYVLRLGAFCIISEPCFDLAFYGKLYYAEKQNVFFTLLLGFCTVWLIDALWRKKLKNSWLNDLKDLAAFLAGTGAGCMLAVLLQTDYSYRGILFVVGFYCLRSIRVLALVWMGLVNCFAERLLTWLKRRRMGFPFYGDLMQVKLQDSAILAILPILLYNGQKGRSMKWLFYVFYPVHLLLLYMIHQLIVGGGL